VQLSPPDTPPLGARGIHQSSYRWKLHRTVSDTPGRLLWVMLNPSTADATTDDPTIRRVVRFTRDNGFGQLCVVNLYAYRATDPDQLAHAPDPVGHLNRAAVISEVWRATAIVCAWGAHAAARRAELRHAIAWHAQQVDRPVFCLGVTANGAPRHPLYVRADQQFVPYTIAPR